MRYSWLPAAGRLIAFAAPQPVVLYDPAYSELVPESYWVSPRGSTHVGPAAVTRAPVFAC